MKKNFYYYLIGAVMLLPSCTEENITNNAEGFLNVKLHTDGKMAEENSRTTAQQEPPNANDFRLSITTPQGEEVAVWEKFSEFQPATLKIGSYTLTASHGNAQSEGFEGISYAGSTQTEIKKNETSNASILCTINKAKVSITYTEAFKKYFSTYSAYIISSQGNKISYTSEETRGAYYIPGDLKMYLEVTRAGNSNKIELNPKNFKAEIKHEYRLTMDVNASSATLKIIFNDNPSSTENVEINISDEALNAAPPKLTPHGFTSGQAVEVLEGNSVEGRMDVFVNAPSGLAKCELITTSEAMKALGWPLSVDLMNLSEDDSKKLTELGLATQGMGIHADKIATVDFRSVIPNLLCTQEGNEDHLFTLKATDKFTKVSEELTLKITTRNNGFAVNWPETAPYGCTSLSFDMMLEGNTENVSFEYFYMGAYQTFNKDKVRIVPAEDGTPNKHTVTLTFDKPQENVASGIKLRAKYGSKIQEGSIKIGNPEVKLFLKNGEGDVWAKHIVMQVELTAKLQAKSRAIDSDIEFQYKGADESWNKYENVSYNTQNGFTLRGLTPNSNYTFRAVFIPDNQVVSNEVSIHTEEVLNIPNGGMEEWHSNKITEDGTDLAGNDKVYWNKWYPWNEDQKASKGWNTLNQTTTQYGAKPSVILGFPKFPYVGCCYTTNSGTIRTDNKHTGMYAALIRTVGWGHDNQADGRDSQQVTAGELYLGSYEVSSHSPVYGYPCKSRPTGISFFYQYIPKNNADFWEVEIKVKDEHNNEIGRKIFNKSGNVNQYTKEIIPIEYSIMKKAASLSIVFRSSGNKDCLVSNKDNLSYPPFANLSDGEYVGSQLYIDDIELIYE